MEGKLVFTTQDQCDCGCGFLGAIAAEKSRRSWKVEDASEEPPCLLCICAAHHFYSLTKLLLGPQRIRQENLCSEHQSYFCLCTEQGDTAAVGQGSAVPDTQLDIEVESS